MIKKYTLKRFGQILGSGKTLNFYYFYSIKATKYTKKENNA